VLLYSKSIPHFFSLKQQTTTNKIQKINPSFLFSQTTNNNQQKPKDKSLIHFLSNNNIKKR